MSNMARAVPESAAPGSGIPLDLAPLLTPYGQNQRLFIRVVQLPRSARFSRGSGNDDGTWSLKPDDLDGLELLLPDDEDPPKTLSIRIVGIDREENATIVAQMNVPLPPTTKSAKSGGDGAWQRRMERRVAAALRLGRRRTAAAVAEAVAEAETRWQANSDKQLSESLRPLEDEWQQKVEAERSARAEAEARTEEAVQRLAALSKELDAARARVATVEAAGTGNNDGQRDAEEAEARLAQAFDHKLAAARAAWEEESEARLAAAVTQAKEAAGREIETAREQRLQAESDVERLESRLAEAEAQWKAESETQLAERVRQLEEGWQRKVEAEHSARAQAEARAEEATQRLAALSEDLEDATRQRVEAECEAGQLTTRLAELETQQAASEAQVAERARQLEESWQQKVEVESRARAAAESRADDAARRLSTLATELEAARAQVAAAEAAGGEAEAEARLAQRVEAQVTAARAGWERDNRARLDAAVKQAVGETEGVAKRQLEAARRDWDKELQSALAVAEGRWRGEEAKRLAAARAEWQREFRSEVGRAKRGLRSVALRQRLARFGRLSLRMGLVAGGLAAAYVFYPQIKPVIVDDWTPKITALAGDLKTTALNELRKLQLLPEGPKPEAAPQPADPQLASPRMSVAARGANLRSGPSTTMAVVTALPRDTVVTVLERHGDWVRIEVEGDATNRGWLHSSLLAGVAER